MRSVVGVGVFALGGCSASGGGAGRAARGASGLGAPPPQVAAMYAAAPNERFAIPSVAIQRIPKRFWRRRVSYSSPHRPGTVIVDTRSFHLYLTQAGGKAMRYGVSLGKAGFAWSGAGVIHWKRPWPTWTPPDEMIARQPELARWSARNGGMPPGLKNPLGARALYIFQNGRDTLYRVHGTPHNNSIGRAVSSGCVRMINQDVIDLFRRVRPGAKIVVV